jgi:hypothetical protein
MAHDRFLGATALLDYNTASMASLVRERGWSELAAPFDRVGAVYTYVRDEIAFGYNRSDDIPASAVLADSYGQCNTKATLLMALLRSIGVRCRLQGATIHKELQRGAVSGLWYLLAPAEIIHTWVEAELDGEWIGLEGVILDRRYLEGVRQLTHVKAGPFMGYAVATNDLAAPPIAWIGKATKIQAMGIARRFGTFDSPDAFYVAHHPNLTSLRRALYCRVIRHRLNDKVAAIRAHAPAMSAA